MYGEYNATPPISGLLIGNSTESSQMEWRIRVYNRDMVRARELKSGIRERSPSAQIQTPDRVSFLTGHKAIILGFAVAVTVARR